MVLASQPFSGEIVSYRWKTPEGACLSLTSSGRLLNNISIEDLVIVGWYIECPYGTGKDSRRNVRPHRADYL
jgi:hypothetical protein